MALPALEAKEAKEVGVGDVGVSVVMDSKEGDVELSFGEVVGGPRLWAQRISYRRSIPIFRENMMDREKRVRPVDDPISTGM